MARDERVLVVGLAAAVMGVVATMRMLLTSLRDEAEIKQPQPTTQYITQETEDSLKPNTLDTLLSHYNYSIREISGKIVTERAVNDGETIDYLLWGITQADYDERLKCLRTLAFITDPRMIPKSAGQWRNLSYNESLSGFPGLVDLLKEQLYMTYSVTHHSPCSSWSQLTWKVETIPKFNTPRAYSAFVRSLEHCLVDRAPLDKLDDKWFDEYGLRDMAEKLPLMFLSQLMQKYGPEQVAQAGFVEKWLAKQNWGDTPEEREHNFFQYLYKSNRIVEIIQRIQQCPMGREALVKTGLISKSMVDDFGMGVFATIHIQTEVIDGDNAEPMPRNLEQSPEEQRIRHRNREAMVLNDGTRPLDRSDIIERQHSTPPPP